MPKPTVNLDPLRAKARELLNRDPMIRTLVGIAELAAPEAAAAVRALDANLPQVLAGVQLRAGRELQKETRAASQALAAGIGDFVRKAMKAGGTLTPKSKRLAASNAPRTTPPTSSRKGSQKSSKARQGTGTQGSRRGSST